MTLGEAVRAALRSGSGRVRRRNQDGSLDYQSAIFSIWSIPHLNFVHLHALDWEACLPTGVACQASPASDTEAVLIEIAAAEIALEIGGSSIFTFDVSQSTRFGWYEAGHSIQTNNSNIINETEYKIGWLARKIVDTEVA